MGKDTAPGQAKRKTNEEIDADVRSQTTVAASAEAAFDGLVAQGQELIDLMQAALDGFAREGKAKLVASILANTGAK